MSSGSEYYPPISSWGLDPMYHSFRKMLISSLLADLEVVPRTLYYEMYPTFISAVNAIPSPLLFSYLYRRPIKRVEIVGIVVR